MAKTVELVAPTIQVKQILDHVDQLRKSVAKEKLRQDLKAFAENLRDLARLNEFGGDQDGDQVHARCVELCRLSRRILFGIWPEEDGCELAEAVIKMFFAAAEQIPDSTDEFPLLSDYRDNIVLRARDLQPFVCAAT